MTLLRFQGIPCRYVTGYVVTELEDEYGDYWLARNRNAHAWAEAYDEINRQWVIVEATLGMSVPRDDGPSADEDGEAGRSADRSAREQAADSTWFGERWLARWESVAGWLKYPLPAVGAAAALLLLAGAARSRSQRAKAATSRRVARLQRMLARLDRRLRRRNFVRHSHETLHQFALRLRQASREDDRLGRCADWYLQYARLRYADEATENEPLLPHPSRRRRRG